MPTSTLLPVDPAVLVITRALRGHGLLADVHVLSVCGDPDVRLLTCRQGGDVAVELLASLAAERPSDRWAAVQVRGGDREVRHGPSHDAPTIEVVRFVETLLDPAPPGVPSPRLR